MDPTTAFCPNWDCPARGQSRQGNIGIHSQKEQRFICKVCRKTFSATKGTVFYRLRHSAETVVIVVTLLTYGCPVQAIVAAFGLDERTVATWWTRAGQQSQKLHEHQVERPMDLGHIQADQIRVKKQHGIVWMAMAIQVKTRLWLGGEVSEHRDMTLIRALMTRGRRCAMYRPLLICTDGLKAYIRAARETFRDPVVTGHSGRPKLRPWRHLLIAQVIKRTERRRVVEIERRIIDGTAARVETLRRRSQGDGVINTAYIERLNATFRQRLSALARRGRSLARRTGTLRHGMYVVGSVYNFCWPHLSLDSRRQTTPAMAAGITDHCWSLYELLSFKVPPPQWQPPKRRGRPSRALQGLIERWCRDHD
ncbi:MAG: hypothetical protein ETSY1_41745 [Candidatus Entotheonella factor]|uniref:DDE domain-containing protein n=1 Tax=Entotheonella factor TaxID=1429438 RepID=W4L4A5_ENTF1|nr:MAG: hypothetical protein ETSY1_41745 [Candidatus Entotheonella factor]